MRGSRQGAGREQAHATASGPRDASHAFLVPVPLGLPDAMPGDKRALLQCTLVEQIRVFACSVCTQKPAVTAAWMGCWLASPAQQVPGGGRPGD